MKRRGFNCLFFPRCQKLLQKYPGKTLHQSFWREIRKRRSCRSHSELRKHKIVVEEDIGVYSTKVC